MFHYLIKKLSLSRTFGVEQNFYYENLMTYVRTNLSSHRLLLRIDVGRLSINFVLEHFLSHLRVLLLDVVRTNVF